jgi:hypothetical protein
MTVTLPIAIVALLVSFLLGLGVGYSLLKRPLDQARQRLQKQKQRLEAMEAAHAERLQTKVERMQADFQAELSRQIAHYQDQLLERTQDLQQEHQTYLEVMQQATLVAGNGSQSAAVTTPPEAQQALKKQYESRLKEAAQKLQQAYEQQLAHHVRTNRSDIQQAYESRLAQKIEHYENQLTSRLQQLEEEFTARQGVLTIGNGPEVPPNPQAPMADPHSPSAIMGTGNDDPTVTLAPGSYPLAGASPGPVRDETPTPPSPPENLQDLVADKVAEVRQMYETRLADQLAQYQDRWVTRMEELEAEYSDRLTAVQQVAPPEPPPNVVEQLDSLDLGDISDLS